MSPLCRPLADDKEPDLATLCPMGPTWPFVVCLLAHCRQLADGKEAADGKYTFCHQPFLCRQLADDKEVADGKLPDSSSVD